MLFYSDAEPLSVCYPIGFNGSLCDLLSHWS